MYFRYGSGVAGGVVVARGSGVKVGQFLTPAPIQNIRGRMTSTIDMTSVMDQHRIFLANFSQGNLGEEKTSLIGSVEVAPCSSRPRVVHCWPAAVTIATIPAFTGPGRLAHARITVARSSGICDTHMTHFSCKKVSFWCLDVCCWCSEGEEENPTSVDFCGACVSDMLF
jgi:hypothetical protein